MTWLNQFSLTQENQEEEAFRCLIQERMKCLKAAKFNFDGTLILIVPHLKFHVSAHICILLQLSLDNGLSDDTLHLCMFRDFGDNFRKD